MTQIYTGAQRKCVANNSGKTSKASTAVMFIYDFLNLRTCL